MMQRLPLPVPDIRFIGKDLLPPSYHLDYRLSAAISCYFVVIAPVGEEISALTKCKRFLPSGKINGKVYVLYTQDIVMQIIVNPLRISLVLIQWCCLFSPCTKQPSATVFSVLQL